MNARGKALVVPLVVLAIWVASSPSSNVVVAGSVEFAGLSQSPTASTIATQPLIEPLADAAPTTLDAPVLTTTSSVVTTTIEPAPAPSTTAAPLPSTTTSLASPTTTVQVTTTVAATIGEQALDRVAYDWRTRFPDWEVSFMEAREGIRALTYPAERRIEIFVRSSDSPATLHRVFAHELGHLVDVELNSDSDRAAWFDTRGISQSTPWWPSASAPDFDTGAGDFAEAFAVWETGVSSRSTVGDQPDADDLALLRDLANS